MAKPVELTIRATPQGLRAVTLSHDPGDREAALTLLQHALPALRVLDQRAREAAEGPHR